MAQDYDKILKENLEPMFTSLGQGYLGIDIAKAEPLKDKLQKTVEREADFLQKVTTTTGETLIVHVELQSTDHPQMLERMRLYHALIKQKYHLPIKQYVIYLGHKPSKMLTELAPDEVFRGYELISLNNIDAQPFLEANIPEKVLWAVFSKFDEDEAPTILTKIIDRLSKLIGSGKSLEKYIFQLITLSRLRNLSEVTQQILQNMPITYDIKKDAFYKEGLQEGIMKGRQEGVKEGKLEEKKDIALRMKEAGFSTADIIKVTGLTQTQIEQL